MNVCNRQDHNYYKDATNQLLHSTRVHMGYIGLISSDVGPRAARHNYYVNPVQNVLEMVVLGESASQETHLLAY